METIAELKKQLAEVKALMRAGQLSKFEDKEALNLANAYIKELLRAQDLILKQFNF